MWDYLSVISVYITTGIWTLVALLALIYSIAEYLDDRRDLDWVRPEGAVFLSIVAETKLDRAFWIMIACALMLSAGATSAVFIALVAPVPDSSIVQVVLRLILIALPFTMLKAKRADRRLRHRILRVETKGRNS